MIDGNFWPDDAAFLDLSAVQQVTDGRAHCTGVAICDDEGRPTTRFFQGQRAHFFYEFEILGDIEVPSGGLEFHDAEGRVIHGKNSFQFDGQAPPPARKGTCLRYHQVLELDVYPDAYAFTVGLASVDAQSYRGYMDGSLTYEQFQLAARAHCRAVDAGGFIVGYDAQGKLRHHGIANLPGDSQVRVVEQPAKRRELRPAAPAVPAAPPAPAVFYDVGPDAPPTVFHITHWKAGSQWINKILHDCVGNLIVAPEVSEVQFKTRPIQVGKVYPTVYVTRQQYDRVPLPPNSHRFVIIRDLRDTLVSGYFSLKVSHPLIAPRLEYWRSMLQQMSVAQGFIYLLDEWLPPSADIQRSWLESGERLIRYEELLERDLEILEPLLLDECRLAISRKQLRNAVLKNRFERLTRGRARGQENINVHERKGIAGDWQNYFDDDVKDAFKSRFGDLLIATGYERDHNW